MARRNQTLELVLSGNSRGAENAIERVDKRTGRFNQTLGRATKVAAGLALALGATVGAALAFSVKGFVEAGAEIQRWSDRSGIAVETLSAMDHAAKALNLDLEDLVDVSDELAIKANDTAEGSKTYANIFKELGINVKDFLALSPEKRLFLFEERLRGIEDATRRTIIADELASDSGKRFLAVVQQNEKGLQGLIKEAHELGVVLSAEDAEAAAELDRRMKQLGARISAVKFNIARALVPTLIELHDWLGPRLAIVAQWLADIWDNRLQPALSAGVAQIRELGAALGFLEGGGETELHPALQWIADNQETLQVVGAIAAGILTAVIAFKAFMAAVAGVSAVIAIAKGLIAAVAIAIGAISLPVLLVVAAIAALVAGFILLYTRSDGVRSFIHDKLLPALSRFGAWFKDTGLPAVAAFAQYIGGALRDAFVGVKTWVEIYVLPALEAIGIKIQEAWVVIGPILAAIGDAVAVGLGAAVTWIKDNWEPISTVLEAPFKLAKIGIVATFDLIKTVVQTALQLITGDWEGAVDTLSAYVERSKERIKAAFRIMLDVGAVFLSAGARLGAKVIDGIKAVWAIKGEAFRAIVGALLDVGQVFLDAGKELAGQLIAGISSGLSSLGDVIGGAVGGVLGGIGLPDINIPGFAAGGVVPATPGGRIVRVGEGGRDEAIVPLGRGGGGAGGNTYITVDAALGDPDAIADRLYPVLQALERRGTISIITAGA